MSRIGKQPIQIPANVTATVHDSLITVTGAKGELSYNVSPLVSVRVEDGAIIFTIDKDSREARAQWGLWRSLVANAVVGVSEGFEKTLELVGVGYRVQKKGTDLELALGYSHKLEVEAPEGIQLDVEDAAIKIRGIDLQLVGQVAANIRSLRKPEPYKGKGIRYQGEVVRLKPGKAAKVGGA
ncbi:50S ribosomal protein L6 [candidate division WWE3 bacterium CG_4_10_14_0_2_um_filter_41_14]|uniref:Large ribosomal subunit protein uL6 n=1 Tax=candidate division WWE3 bacterium CG_4_10_14_0_2_um_filter_41_14 TaxID=1975072 RepID=A0A2M7TF36_UNCKA|nr:MAG: 50S ribosomal protein L6 [candidate division WWE3 bacterium CG_4_10_14_0_2_um_filter_41_14]